MNRRIHPLSRLLALATTILGLVLVTASRAAAMRPDPPAPADPGSVHERLGTTSVLRVTDSSIDALQWALFAAAVVGALLIGAACMHLAERHRAQLAH